VVAGVGENQEADIDAGVASERQRTRAGAVWCSPSLLLQVAPRLNVMSARPGSFRRAIRFVMRGFTSELRRRRDEP
jgi:hypothetical protein